MIQKNPCQIGLMTKNLGGGAYPGEGAKLREGAYQNLESQRGANLREDAKSNKYGSPKGGTSSKKASNRVLLKSRSPSYGFPVSDRKHTR